MFLHVEEVHYQERYKLRLRFNDNTTKDVDLEGDFTGKYLSRY